VLALAVLAVLGAGALTGVLWRLVAPLPHVTVQAGQLIAAESEGESAVAADGWFGLCCLVAGVLSAVLVFAIVRSARLEAVVAVTIGALVASLVAWRVGLALSPDPVTTQAKQAANGAVLEGPLRLSAKGVLFAWPLAAVAVYFALGTGLDRHRGEQPGTSPAEPVTADERSEPASPP
jgi:hypothetical protein